MEDALKAHQRPKLEVYEDSLFAVPEPVVYEPESDAVSTDELMIFLGDAFVVVVRHGEGAPLKAVRQRLEHEPELLGKGPTAVLYAIADAAVDHYLDVAVELQNDLEELEAEVFSPDGGGCAAHRVPDLHLQAAGPGVPPGDGPAGAAAGPAGGDGAFGAGVPFVNEKARPFFRDVSDHLTRVNESVEGLDRLVSDILSAHLAQTSVRQNDDMRKISRVGGHGGGPHDARGVYGMNFDHMPELHWEWGYPAVIVLMAALEVLLFRLFKRRGWL